MKPQIEIVVLIAFSLFSSFLYLDKPITPATQSIISTPDTMKLAALAILENRCNSCHQTQNPHRVFTLDNMDKLANRINRQVFVFKRMPKGRERRKNMPEAEFQTLKKWIKQTLKK